MFANVHDGESIIAKEILSNKFLRVIYRLIILKSQRHSDYLKIAANT